MQTRTTLEQSKSSTSVSAIKRKQQPFFSPITVQPKLTIGTVDDPFEHEANAMADKVMRLTESSESQNSFFKPAVSSVQRKCAHCEEEEKLQRKSESGVSSCIEAPSVVHDVINSGGQTLDSGIRKFFEPRFGHDFSNVKIHSDSSAVKSAQRINALAYTTGDNIVFNQNQFSPGTDSGKKLLAHELTHVVQQAADPSVVRCDFIDDLRTTAEAAATTMLNNLANKPVTSHSSFTGHAGCHPNFCQPFASIPEALADLSWAGPMILAGIATKVNPRVVPLWASYISGGSAPKNLSSDFGNDFSASPTTANTTIFLINELRKDIESNHISIMSGASFISLDFTPRLSTAVAAIDNPADPNQMNFNTIGDIAGNIAGGIGKDETTFPIGANPSPFNDSREVSIRALLTRNTDGSIGVVPSITFTVKDTIDLCPGDCGAPAEQVATVPLSRFEATGLSGDIPMIIQFNAPAAELLPFTIPIPVAPTVAIPTTGSVTASSLNIRLAPDISSTRVGTYPRGTTIVVVCQASGTTVVGNDIWYKTDKGFVSARYVSLAGATVPAVC